MITVEKWSGLVTNASAYSLPPGAAVTQVNLQILNPGQLTGRDGTVSVTFSTHTGAAAPVLRAFRFENGTLETIVYQNATGRIYVAKGPA